MTQRKANLLLMSVSMTWGTSYLFMKMGISGIGTFNFIALRFGIAFLITFILFSKKIKHINKRLITQSAILGFILFCLFVPLLQGLKTTTASSAGFLVGTTVAFVPIIQGFIKRKLPESKTIIGIFMVMIGIGFLTLKNGFSVNFGSGLCLLSAIFNAAYIVVTNYFVKSQDGLKLGIFQFGFAALFGGIFSFVFEKPQLPHTTNGWVAVLGLALICSAYGYVVQSIAQKYTTPENTGFLFALEPVFSAIFAFLILHELFNVEECFGAVLILLSIFISYNGIDNIFSKIHIKFHKVKGLSH